MHDALPDAVLAAWPGLRVEPEPFGTGLINLTRRGELDGRGVVLQRVHPAFQASVHEDIEAVTRHLEKRGLTTPLLVRTRDGALSVSDESNRPWRVLTLIEGATSHDRFTTREMVFEAGRIVGRFHGAVADLEHTYVHVRPGIHDLDFRLRGLENAAITHAQHALAPEVDALRARVAALEPRCISLQHAPTPRHAHGDLKASNLLFDARGAGLCLVDLDTLASMSLVFELGDAIRSWCNPRREDEPGAGIEPDLYRAALAGFARGVGDDLAFTHAEVELLPRGVLTIAVELALRFLTDALEERYFAFDPQRFASRGAQNLARARGQLALADSLHTALPELERITRDELSRTR
ncbi:MAG: phosphotransferase [Polyangiaceae bacterium]